MKFKLISSVLFLASYVLFFPFHSEPAERETAHVSETLLEIFNGNSYGDSPFSMHWGDSSGYKRYVMHFNVPEKPSGGGMDFRHERAFLAVNDGFMAGLDHFTISFWFMALEDGPSGLNTNGNGGVLVCSNWATLNEGDWLLGFGDDGGLVMLIQRPGEEVALRSRVRGFLKGRKYSVSIRKTEEEIFMLIDDKLQDSMAYRSDWPENGAPLAIGANPYDRGGMGYFNGVIGGFKIVTRSGVK